MGLTAGAVGEVGAVRAGGVLGAAETGPRGFRDLATSIIPANAPLTLFTNFIPCSRICSRDRAASIRACLVASFWSSATFALLIRWEMFEGDEKYFRILLIDNAERVHIRR